MLIEQIIEFELRGASASWSYINSYKWLFSWQINSHLKQILEWIIYR